MKILLKNGKEYEPTDAEIRMYAECYPRIDVREQIKAMAAWCLANPSRRKTERGVDRFINSWLARTQERTPRPKGQTFAAAHKPFEKEAPRQMTKEAGLAGIAALKDAMKR